MNNKDIQTILINDLSIGQMEANNSFVKVDDNERQFKITQTSPGMSLNMIKEQTQRQLWKMNRVDIDKHPQVEKKIRKNELAQGKMQ